MIPLWSPVWFDDNEGEIASYLSLKLPSPNSRRIVGSSVRNPPNLVSPGRSKMMILNPDPTLDRYTRNNGTL